MERLLSFWRAAGGGIVGRWYFFPVCLIAICGTALFVGAVPTRVFGHDIFFLLDNGWRVINGQCPHVDFASSWGPITFLITGLGLILSGYSVDGIGYGSAAFAFLVGFWCFRLGRDRIDRIPRTLLSLYLVALIVAPYPLGWGIFHTGHAMVYNRYGYALLGLVMLESFEAAVAHRQETEEWIGGISSGAALALSLFLKVSYFFVAAILIGASFALRGFPRRRLLGMSVGFALVTTSMLAYLGFDLQAVLGDLKMAAGARSETISYPELRWKFLVNTPYLALAGWLGFRGSLAVTNTGCKKRDFSLLFLASVVFAADMLLLFSNQQRTELPLTAMFALLVVNRVTACSRTRTERAGESDRAPVSRGAALLAGGLLFLLQFGLEFSGLAYGALLKARPPRQGLAARFAEPRLAPLLFYDGFSDPRSNGCRYTTYVNEGVFLLRRNTGPNETVLTMDMMNPFPYALGRRPAIGGVAAAAYRYTLSDTHRPSDDRFFGNADVVMVPKQPASPQVYYDGFYRMYESALHERFRLAEESNLWYLYKRR